MKNFFIRLTLVILVGISLFLSFFIWTNNRIFSRTGVITNHNVAPPVDYSRNLANLYNPVKVFSVDDSGNKNFLPDQLSSTTELTKKALHKVDLRRLLKYKADSNKQYETLLESTDSIQLYYQAPVSLKILAELFGFKYDQKIANFPTNRMIVRKVSPIETEIYFANDQSCEYYYLSLLLKREQLFAAVTQTKNKIPVKEERLGSNYLTKFEKPIPLKSYVYLVKTLDDSFYVSNFMTNDGSAGLTYDSKNNLYKKGLTKSLAVNNEAGLVHFADYHLDPKQVPNNLSSLLKTSRDTMQKIGNPFNSFRYFAKPTSNHVVFRSYIGGFPVFYNEERGDVSLSWHHNSLSFYFSNVTLEIPISTSQNTVNLEPTDSLLQKLKAKGVKMNEIQDIQIGYSWVKNNDNSEVVNLMPEYFVKIKGTYQEVAAIMNPNPKGES